MWSASRTVQLIGLLLVAVPAQALEETAVTEPSSPLQQITDRPDFTESADTVPRGFTQFEIGLLDYTTLGDDDELSTPNTLARIGVLEDFELRLLLPSYEVSFAGEDPDHDVTPVEVGAKGVMDLGDRWRVGLLPFMVLPTRPEQFGAGEMEFGTKIVSSVLLTDVYSLGANLGISALGLGSDVIDPSVEYTGSLALGIGITERSGMFVEIYTFADEDDGFAPVVDGGFTYLLGHRTQLDAYFGVGFLDASQGINTGFGLSVLAG